MRRGLLFALLLAPAFALAQAQETLFNLVALQAQAEREVPNDLLSATLAAEAEGTDPAQLSAEVNRAMQAALAAAKGYSAVRVRSGNYQTFPIYEKNRITRWRVRQELRVESADFAAATELIGKLQANLTVAGMGLSVSPAARRQAENALIPEALAAFEDRARVVREAMKARGQRMQNLQITASGGVTPIPFATMRSGVSASASATVPSIEAGTTRVLITVSGTIQLQQ